MEKLSKKITETRCAGAGGQYLPLSVYAAQGYDTKAIEEGCKDVKAHPLFGKVYRVEIEYQNKESKEQMIREAILKSVQERQSKGGSSSGGGGVGPHQPKAKAKAKAKALPSTICTKKMSSESVKVLAKVAPLKFGMEAAMLHKKICEIPKVHKTKMKSFLAELKAFEQAAQETVSNQALLKLEMSDVSERCLQVQNHLSLVNGMLNSMG